jgi:hypothetical protein
MGRGANDPDCHPGTCLSCGSHSALRFVQNPGPEKSAAHATPKRQICAETMAHLTALTAVHIRQLTRTEVSNSIRPHTFEKLPNNE